MDSYLLSYEGRARFKRTKISVEIEGKVKMEGYEILDYLYEHGAATVEEIENHTGLSWGEVADKLGLFIHSGYVEKLGGQ
jgi:DNA-binding MarR family transcriptional regulator